MTDQDTLGKYEGAGKSADAAKVFADGRRSGLATAALAVGVVSFLSMLGVEKAALAVVLGVLAIRGAAPGSSARRLGMVAVLLGGLFVVTLIVLLAVFRNEFAELLRSLRRLS